MTCHCLVRCQCSVCVCVERERERERTQDGDSVCVCCGNLDFHFLCISCVSYICLMLQHLAASCF